MNFSYCIIEMGGFIMSELQQIVDEISNHVNGVTSLNSFEGVQEWDDKSKGYVLVLENELNKLKSEIEETNNKYENESREFASLGFLKKIGKKDPSIETKISLDSLKGNFSKIEWLKNTIDEWIDLTPDNIDECKQMIKEYKLLRKELVLEKKSATTSLRNTREQSMERMSKMGFTNGSVGRFLRDVERMKKQVELNKHQSLRDQIEQRINGIDRRILWLEKISN